MTSCAFPALANAASDPRHHLLVMAVNELRAAMVLLRAPDPGAAPTFEVEVAAVRALDAPLPLEIVLRAKHKLLLVVLLLPGVGRSGLGWWSLNIGELSVNAAEPVALIDVSYTVIKNLRPRDIILVL